LEAVMVTLRTPKLAAGKALLDASSIMLSA
jgi:hypothetical protein